jgi:hypothetical protein
MTRCPRALTRAIFHGLSGWARTVAERAALDGWFCLSKKYCSHRHARNVEGVRKHAARAQTGGQLDIYFLKAVFRPRQSRFSGRRRRRAAGKSAPLIAHPASVTWSGRRCDRGPRRAAVTWA